MRTGDFTAGVNQPTRIIQEWVWERRMALCTWLRQFSCCNFGVFCYDTTFQVTSNLGPLAGIDTHSTSQTACNDQRQNITYQEHSFKGGLLEINKGIHL